VTTVPPAHRADLASAVVGDRTVLLDHEAGRVHWLSASAAAIWARCDGRASLATITDDVAVAFGIDPLVIADDVARTVADLADIKLLGPVVRTRAADAGPAADGVRRVPISCPSCVVELDRLGWTEPFAVHVGRTRFGIRSNHPDVDALLRRLLAAHIVDDASVAANFSVRLVEPAPAGGGPRELHQLYDDKIRRCGSPSATDVVAHLLAVLGNRRHHDASGASTVSFAATGLVLADGVHLGPLVWEAVPTVARRLDARLLPRPVAVDPVDGMVVVAPPIEVDPAAWSELIDRWGEPTRRGPAAPGRYRLHELVFTGVDAGADGALAAAVAWLDPETTSGDEALRACLRVLHDDDGRPRFRWVDPGFGELDALRRPTSPDA